MANSLVHPGVVRFAGDGVAAPLASDRTLLELSLAAGVPHAHICGGNGRCSTCRVTVLDNAHNLTPPTDAERALAAAQGLGPEVRLACQCRPLGDVRVRRGVRDEEDHLLLTQSDGAAPRERRLAVLFSDIRDFTAFSESHLPYDTVHILNRYHHLMGEAVLANGGYIDKIMGDGIMALFGLNAQIPCGADDAASRAAAHQACVDAVQCGLTMQAVLDGFNDYLFESFNLRFRIGVGVHFGNVVLGNMGHPQHKRFTAIGDTVNLAARAESMTKELGHPLLATQSVIDALGARALVEGSSRVKIKGKRLPQELYKVTGLTRERANNGVMP
ncbi:adenylate/guanylate cyclase domain-containing protein [Magnetofaba australis]|uniref:Putative adenylate/guanylate cyclase n=1 Tax=Magnetofaba australis IT-1 TaxID=1434232 RepID=A0A1Y2K4U7_9PROT|nr:adenylate/guanylate cyclase domain-containing protein [Magnetofaba australis]OSM02144.1 putative adenylate/guanylate cyclase [Magnetofaba australis IT-1]